MGQRSSSFCDNHYRLVMEEDGSGDPRTIEFEAPGAQSALILAARHCGGRRVEVFENGRSLGSIRNEEASGYWVLTGRLAAGLGSDGQAQLASLRSITSLAK